MIGELPEGGFATSPMAAYPPGMCYMFALHIFNDFMENGPGKTRVPCGRDQASREAPTPLPTHTQSSSSRSGAKPTLRPRTEIAATPTSTSREEPAGSWSSVTVSDIPFRNEIISQAKIDAATKEADEKGIGRPLREGPDLDFEPHLSADEVEESATGAGSLGDATTDEEPEIPGLQRPKLGAG